ncbi:MAG: hypothetical protein JWM49_100, partial [Microbacteriaceae bacterium]|nr:hypothetical protein [Microbacteriaceae bacterium]
ANRPSRTTRRIHAHPTRQCGPPATPHPDAQETPRLAQQNRMSGALAHRKAILLQGHPPPGGTSASEMRRNPTQRRAGCAGDELKRRAVCARTGPNEEQAAHRPRTNRTQPRAGRAEGDVSEGQTQQEADPSQAHPLQPTTPPRPRPRARAQPRIAPTPPPTGIESEMTVCFSRLPSSSPTRKS